MYLYLGYLLVQFWLLGIKLVKIDMSVSALFFTVVIIFIWSFIPVVGYLLAKLFKANGRNNKYMLFAFGLGIALIERALFYFELLTKDQSTTGTFIAFSLFFIVAFISTKQSTQHSNVEQ